MGEKGFEPLWKNPSHFECDASTNFATHPFL